jgi:L-rhamnose mutarotase
MAHFKVFICSTKVALAALILGATLSVIPNSLCAQQKVQRIGMVIGIKPDRISAYKALHAESNPGVRDLLNKYHMHNFSIFIHQLDNGQFYLFGYYEYTGHDYVADMQKLADEPRNKEWLSKTSILQIPLPGETSWANMEEVYHNP